MEGSYFQKAKTVQTTSSLVIVWAIDVDDIICEGCKKPVVTSKKPVVTSKNTVVTSKNLLEMGE